MEQPIITKAFSDKKFKIMGFRIVDLGYIFVTVIFSLIIGVSLFNSILLKVIGSLGLILFFLIGIIPLKKGPLYRTLPNIIWKFTSKNKFSSKEQVSSLIPIYNFSNDYLISESGAKTCAYLIGGIDLSILDPSEVQLKLNLYEQFIKSINVDMFKVKVDERVKLVKYKNWLSNKIKEANSKLKVEQLKDYKKQISLKETEYDTEFYIIFSSQDDQKLVNAENSLKNFLTKIQLRFKRLDDLESINLLKNMYFNLNKDDFTAKDLFNNQNSLDLLLAYNSLKIKNNYIIAKENENTNYLSFNSIDEYPLYPSMNWFFNISLESGTVISKITQLSSKEVNKRVNNANIKTRVNQKLNNNLKLTQEIEEESDLNSINELALNLKMGNEKLFMVSTTFVNFGLDLEELRQNENNLKTQLESQDFKISNQNLQQLETFTSSFPGSKVILNPVKAQEISSLALAISFPFIDDKWIDLSGHYLGNTNTWRTFILNFFIRKSNVLSGNGIVIGTSGSGKTKLLAKIVNNNVVTGVKTIIFDPERTEYLNLIQKWNGQIINVAQGNETKINPLQILLNVDTKKLSIDALISNHLQVLEEWIINLYPTLGEMVLEAFLKSVQECYKNSKFYSKKIKDWHNKDFPIFKDLKPYILKEASKSKDLIRLEYIINNFTENGKYANLWNGYTNVNLDSHLILFDFADFGSASQNTRIKSAQLSLLTKIVDNIIWNNDLTGDGKIQIIVDEAHSFINEESPYALKMMDIWSREIRKRGGSFLLGTQSISDFVKTFAIRDARAILNNSQFSFIGKIQPADLKDLDALYSDYNGFTDNEKAKIRTQEVGEFLFINGGNEKLFFKTIFSDLEKETIGWKEDTQTY